MEQKKKKKGKTRKKPEKDDQMCKSYALLMDVAKQLAMFPKERANEFYIAKYFKNTHFIRILNKKTWHFRLHSPYKISLSQIVNNVCILSYLFHI